MPDPRQYVRPGQKLQIAASQINALNQMMRQDTGFRAPPPSQVELAPNIVLIKNNSGVDVPWLGVLAISGIETGPSGSSFATQPVLRGGVPAVNSRVVVAMEPIAKDKVGRAAASGVFACRVNVTEESHNFAVADAGFVTRLKSAACGPVELLWKEGGLGDKWAVGSM